MAQCVVVFSFEASLEATLVVISPLLFQWWPYFFCWLVLNKLP